MNYSESINWIEGVTAYGRKDGLVNMFQLMERLGNPQERVPAIHVAGTNGKGTTCAVLASMLRAKGLNVGLYTSPHLVDYTERIRINGEPVSKKTFAALATRVRTAAEAMQREGLQYPAFFQILTAMAFVHFAAQALDFMVIEVGMGGRLDATNILRQPVASVITSISLDHTKTLGNTIAAIAGEKAGIIKPGVPVVVCHNSEEAMQVFRGKAAECGAPLYSADDLDYRILQNTETGILLESGGSEFRMPLAGNYQVQNLKTALTAARRVLAPAIGLTEQEMMRGVAETRWEGRMQWLTYLDRRILVEGAHNQEGAEGLGQWMREHLADRDITLVFSALRKKDVSAILSGLLTRTPVKRVIFSPLRYEGGMTMEEFITMLPAGSPDVTAARGIRDALRKAARLTDPEGVIVCAGSLYLAGEVLAVV
ncbi:MAG: bifunctional folylpolyglutamate synthase/dihydrofolate synthase [Firmicutes bacterium]|nr:bifunctional folylpolyglutamate synthase/dihydrofolate synthase [Bacillota bacterium]